MYSQCSSESARVQKINEQENFKPFGRDIKKTIAETEPTNKFFNGTRTFQTLRTKLLIGR